MLYRLSDVSKTAVNISHVSYVEKPRDKDVSGQTPTVHYGLFISFLGNEPERFNYESLQQAEEDYRAIAMVESK